MAREEYPDPQFERKNYRSLNGIWQFEIDNEKSGMQRGLLQKDLQMKIEVPFCPESELSGVAYKGDINCCWYKKRFTLAKKELEGRAVIRFGAADRTAQVYLNGHYLGEHTGGYTPFSFELNRYAAVGENEVALVVCDDLRNGVPHGKQTDRDHSYGCFYTRTTGIWQSVGLEFTPENYIKRVRFFPNVAECCVEIEAATEGEGEVSAEVFYGGKPVGRGSAVSKGNCRFAVALSEKHLWEIGEGRLYDVRLTFGKDEVKSYFGLREVRYDGMRFLLNGKSVFQRLVLDQGFYPDGIYTAPSAEAFARDIGLARRLGFNGMRLHQKVFEPRYLYECDRAGMIVWGEYADWGVSHGDALRAGAFLAEWSEAVARDFNHPCIVTWCPLNEAWTEFANRNILRDAAFLKAVYRYTKALDPTRPCVDASGGYHTDETDLADFHCYAGSAELKKHISALEEGDVFPPNNYAEGDVYMYKKGMPVNCSEYGGIAFDAGGKMHDGHSSSGDVWGYFKESDAGAFAEEYCRQAEILLSCKKLSGLCYTQLYDVEQECNGLYLYDRSPKFGEALTERMAACMRMPAEIEKQ